MEHTARVTLLGTRGSIPCSGKKYIRYGGSTTCILVQLAEETIILDGGTGILRLKADNLPSRLSLLLTHPHIDHIIGIPMCPLLMKKDVTLDLYAAPLGGLSAEQQFRTFVQPPLWPIGPEHLPAEIHFHDLVNSVDIGGMHIDFMSGVHPGGVTVYRISGGGKSIVLATDCTYTDELLPSLTEFAKDCDLLLCDGLHSEEEWPACKDFGHNTWFAAAKLGQSCHAKQVRIIHHSPDRSDDALDAAAAEVIKLYPNCRFGYDEEMITL